jgi:hypothetical protein
VEKYYGTYLAVAKAVLFDPCYGLHCAGSILQRN